MKHIWKFGPISHVSHGWSEIKMPMGANIISVGWQGHSPVVWAIVDPEMPDENRKLGFFHTGDQVCPRDVEFLGTVQHEELGGYYVCHVFEN